MSNPLNLVSKSIAALKASLHWQLHPAAKKLPRGQQQRGVTVLGSFDKPTVKAKTS